MKLPKFRTVNLTAVIFIMMAGLAMTQILQAQSQPSQSQASQSQPSQSQPSQTDQDDEFTLNLENVAIRSLIETVAERLDKIFIVDPRVKATVTVISSEPTNEESLYDLFLSVLEVHGFTAVEAGNLTRIVPTTAGVQSAIPVIKERTASDNELVTEVVPVQNMPAQELVEVLRPLLQQSATISAEVNSNTLIITDTAANIARLAEIIRELENSN